MEIKVKRRKMSIQLYATNPTIRCLQCHDSVKHRIHVEMKDFVWFLKVLIGMST